MQTAIDGYVDLFAETGTFDFGQPGTAYPADQPGGGPLTGSEALAVLDIVYGHRLAGENDTAQALLARDPEVAAAYDELLATGRLTTPSSDPAAVLQHLALIRNGGTRGGVLLSGWQVISIGLQIPPVYPAECRVNLAGNVEWPDGQSFNTCLGKEEAVVYLTVRRGNGQVFRAATLSTSCGTRSTYRFRQVPSGSAELLARPVRTCCREGRAAFQITCPPAQWYWPMDLCIPSDTNQFQSVILGPWSPPGFFGVVLGPGAAGARVWIGTRDNACFVAGSSTANSQGLYGVRGCLPDPTPPDALYVYAEGGGKIGRAPASRLSCGHAEEINIALADPPRIEGRILNWQQDWNGKAGALARGCNQSTCHGAADTQMTHFADPTGAYRLTLKPGKWLLSSFRDFGACVNANLQRVQWRCEWIYQPRIDLEPGQVITGLDLQPVLSRCSCPS